MSERTLAIGQGHLLSISLKTEDIPAQGLSGTLNSSKEERAALAQELDVPDIASLSMDYELAPIGGRRFRLTGRVRAQVTQNCVVTLEPVESRIDEPIELELWPKEDVEEIEYTEDEEGTALALDGPEPILEGSINMGQIAYEHFAGALDLYPRKAGAEFQWRDPQADESPQSGTRPFADLENMMRKKGKAVR